MPLTTGPQGPAGIQGPRGPDAAPLAGDAAGTPNATTVTHIQGRQVSATAPAVGQYLLWNGIEWAPGNWPT